MRPPATNVMRPPTNNAMRPPVTNAMRPPAYAPMDNFYQNYDPAALRKKVVSKEELEKKLADIEITEEIKNKLVMNYFLIEGYAEAAEIFGPESGILPEIDLMTTKKRLLIKNAVKKGEIDEAIQKINDLNREILDTNPLLLFHLLLQKFIELVRKKDYNIALDFARDEVVPLRDANPEFTNELEQTVALIGLVDLDTNPCKELLDQAQRNRRANEVNAAILTSQHREKEPRIEKLLKRLIWAECELRETTIFPCLLDLSEATVRDPPHS